jgi:tRNA G18 (ribose-2'-O)-methylase SpoU
MLRFTPARWSGRTHHIRGNFREAWRDDPRNEGLRLQLRDAFGGPADAPTSSTVVVKYGESIPLGGHKTVGSKALWTSAQLVRKNKDARKSLKSCVVGGVDAIRRIWHEHKVRPTCVFTPDDVEVPSWCHHDTLPTVIIRCDAQTTNRSLLSAEHNDGFAAEFPLPVSPSLLDLVDTTELPSGLRVPTAKLSNVVVLHRVLIPSNVGMLLRAAVDMGYDAAVLDQCADAFQEKVLRASAGAAYDPALRIFELDNREHASAPLLQQAAVAHRLLPLFAIPSQDAEPVHTVAQRLHYTNAVAVRDGGGSEAAGIGAMVMLGSESQGLEDMQRHWNVPAKTVSIRMDNPLVTSMNVAMAGTIIMHHFRPKAAAEFRECFEHGIVPDDATPRTAPEETPELTNVPLSSQAATDEGPTDEEPAAEDEDAQYLAQGAIGDADAAADADETDVAVPVAVKAAKKGRAKPAAAKAAAIEAAVPKKGLKKKPAPVKSKKPSRS